MKRYTLLAVGVVGVLPYAHSATWKVSPQVTSSLTYIDNVNLARAGNEDADLIFQLNPGISVKGTGKRLKMDLNYRMQNIAYKDNSSQNDTFHQFDSTANIELVNNRFFVILNGRYEQQLISNTGQYSFDNLSITNNTTDVGSIRVTPYFVHKFSNIADMKLTYQYTDVRYKDSPADSQENSVSLNLSSGKAFNRLDWKLDASRNEIDPDDRVSSSLESYLVSLGYAVTNRVRVYASLGYENNDYPVSGSLDNPEGSIWYGGINWKPVRSTSIDVSVGERFFGNTAALKVNHKTSRSTWSLTYSEDVTTPQDQLFNSGAPTTQPINSSLPSITSEIFLQKRLDIGFGYKTGKSTFDIRAFNDRRIFQTSALEERVYGLQGKWDWKIKPRTSIILSAYGQILSFGTSSQKDGQALLSATFQRNMSRKLTGAIDLVHNRKDSTDNTLDYDQNLISARLSLIF